MPTEKYGTPICINKEEQYLDICIADKGITLSGSYRENNDTDIVSDMEALKAANRGISTKNLPNAENRGYGLITSKKMLTNGLGGLFIMISGSAILIKSETFNELQNCQKVFHVKELS